MPRTWADFRNCFRRHESRPLVLIPKSLSPFQLNRLLPFLNGCYHPNLDPCFQFQIDTDIRTRLLPIPSGSRPPAHSVKPYPFDSFGPFDPFDPFGCYRQKCGVDICLPREYEEGPPYVLGEHGTRGPGACPRDTGAKGRARAFRARAQRELSGKIFQIFTRIERCPLRGDREP